MFDYDFSQERVFLEIAAAERDAKRRATLDAQTTASSRSTSKSDATSADANDRELASRASAALSLDVEAQVFTEQMEEKVVLKRSQSEEDVARAISASLREY